MTRLNFSASCIRGMVRQMKSSSENKAFEKAQYTNLALRTIDGVPTLQMMTEQPTYELMLKMPLLDRQSVELGDIKVEVQTDEEHMWQVRTKNLDKALAGCGQQTTLMEMGDDGTITLCTGRKTLTVEGKCLRQRMKEGLECTSGCSVHMDSLLRGLQTAMEMAAVKGNDLEKSGIHLVITPSELRIEGASLIALAVTSYDAQVWEKAPGENFRDVVLTVDAVRHLLRSLLLYGTDTVTLEVMEDTLAVVSPQVEMAADLQPVNYFDSAMTSCDHYQSSFQTNRQELLQALRSMRAIGEKHVQLQVNSGALELQHVDLAHTTCRMCLDNTSSHLAHDLPRTTYPIAPLISALTSNLDAEKATLRYQTISEPLCMEVGQTRLFVR